MGSQSRRAVPPVRHARTGVRRSPPRLSLAFIVFAACLCAGIATGAKAVGTGKDTVGADLFNSTNIVRIGIEIGAKGMDNLRGYAWYEGSEASDRPEVRARVTEGGKVYTNVAVHLRGTYGSFRPVDARPGLTLNFSKFAEGQTFHGLKKISLNNSVQDQSLMGEKLSRELCAAAGLPVPRSDYAAVTLNGSNFGVYVLLEGYNKQFLHRHFRNTGGNLYDGGYAKDITGGLVANSGDHPEDRTDIARLAAGARDARRSGTLAQLSKALDMDRFYTFLAMEVLICHFDGYAMNRNNFRVFHDLETDRMVFLPHGMDQVFGIGRRGSPDLPVLPQIKGFVAGSVLSTAEGRARYLARLAELRTKIFDAAALANRIRELNDRLSPLIAELEPERARSYGAAVAKLRRNIAQRRLSLDAQLAEFPEAPPAAAQPR